MCPMPATIETRVEPLASRSAPQPAGTTLSSRWVWRARTAWAALTLLTVWLFVVGVPLHPAHPHVLCADVTCSGSESLAQVTRELHSIGLTLGFYLAYILTVKLVFATSYFAVAALIVWRRSDDWMALLVALFLVTFAFIYTDVPGVLARDHLWWWPLVGFAAFVGKAAFPLCLYLFPSGRFAPGWTRWLLCVWLALELPASLAPSSPFNWANWPAPLEALVVLTALGSVVFTQVYRYRYVSSPAQRRQTKWVVLGLAAGLGGFFTAGLFGSIGSRALYTVFPQAHWLISPAVGVAANTLTYLALLLIPLSFAIAILRSRLWDIDFIIHRALVYSTLTGALLLVYAGSIIGLQYVLRGLTSGSDLAVVASTLGIVALFDPLRRRIQVGIDRRFYRRRYDAVRTVEAFAATLRSEVDLARLSEDLLAVVRRTMQPEHVSLWLRPREHTPSLEGHAIAQRIGQRPPAAGSEPQVAWRVDDS